MTAIDPGDGLTADQAQLAVATLADLHAYSPRSIQLRRKPRGTPTELLQGIEQSWAAFRNFCVDFLPDRFYGLQGFLSALELAAVRVRAGPRSFVHGDYKVDNLLFGDVGTDERIAVLDWQGVASGWGIEELAGFLPRSVNDEVASEPLVQSYYHRAAAYGHEKSLSEDEFLALYEHALVLSLAENIATTQTLVNGNWSGGDAVRQQRIVDYAKLTFARKLSVIRTR
jgi:aminoglycoside phosphotransferase (APT) family kinase protein